MQHDKKVSIILLNWNGSEDTIECLKSLSNLNYTNFNILLVDNNSDDNSVNEINKYLSQSNYTSDTIKKSDLESYTKKVDILFILNDSNAGFAGGNNVALNSIDSSKTDYVLLLNNDTIVKEDLIDKLLDVFDEDPHTGFVGTTHYYYDNPDVMQTIGGGMIDYVHGECEASKSLKDEYDFITGSCIMLPVKILEEVGSMCEDYFMYWEDVDWSTKVRNYGYKLKTTDKTCIYHKEGASIQSLRRIYYHTRNRIWYMQNNATKEQYKKFQTYIKLFILKESATNILKNPKYSKTLLKALKDSRRSKS